MGDSACGLCFDFDGGEKSSLITLRYIDSSLKQDGLTVNCINRIILQKENSSVCFCCSVVLFNACVNYYLMLFVSVGL